MFCATAAILPELSFACPAERLRRRHRLDTMRILGMTPGKDAYFLALDQDIGPASDDVAEHETLAAPFRYGRLDFDCVAIAGSTQETSRHIDNRSTDDAHFGRELLP